MNDAFGRVLAAPSQDRRGLFTEAARRLGTSERYIEKDFWGGTHQVRRQIGPRS